MLGVIPCSGFGTRMGMQSNESKEMLVDKTTGKRLIDSSLDLCLANSIMPLVITRQEKKDLIDYCLGRKVVVMLNEPSGEWMNTVLDSFHVWQDDNILLLPDTKFSPAQLVVQDIITQLDDGYHLSIATHQVEDPSKWCVWHDKVLHEKNKDLPVGSYEAFGLIGFKKRAGYNLFNNLRVKGQFSPALEETPAFVRLRSFEDVTRTVNTNLERKSI